MALPKLHTVTEVADAIGQTERYVKEKCRRREWPHARFARGEPRFSAEDFAAVMELCRVEVAEDAEPRWSLAPRSGIRRTA